MQLLLLFVIGILSPAPSEPQKEPTPSFRSSIPPKQRIQAIADIEKLLRSTPATNKVARKAANLLHNVACICEPLGEDSKGGQAYRIIAAPKVKRAGSWFGVMPVYKIDGKRSRMIQEFIDAKPAAVAGIEPDAPIVLLRIDGPKLKDQIDILVGAINTRGK